MRYGNTETPDAQDNRRVGPPPERWLDLLNVGTRDETKDFCDHDGQELQLDRENGVSAAKQDSRNWAEEHTNDHCRMGR